MAPTRNGWLPRRGAAADTRDMVFLAWALSRLRNSPPLLGRHRLEGLGWAWSGRAGLVVLGFAELGWAGHGRAGLVVLAWSEPHRQES